MKRTIITAFCIYIIFHLFGMLIGKVLHDYMAYALIISKFSNYSWFNSSQYVNVYNQYSLGLDSLFMWVFGITCGGLALAFYVEMKAYQKL